VILVDTNAWVAHARAADSKLVRLLQQNRVVTCDVIVGELLLGSGLPPEMTKNLKLLPSVPSPTAEESRRFVERQVRLFRASGVGWADAQILIAAANSGSLIFSSDRAVRRVWTKLGFRLA
jgi:predicted nucleic acid-binding protein